jgi:hypothetical protein
MSKIGKGRIKRTLRDKQIQADKEGGKHSGGWQRKKGKK